MLSDFCPEESACMKKSYKLVTGTRMAFMLAVSILLAAPGPATGQVAPVYSGVDHIEFFVTDLQRSVAFYTRLFGNDLYKHRQTERRYLTIGQHYLAIEEGASARVDHVCFGIGNFDINAVHGYLDSQSIPWQDYPSGRDLRVDDRDGTRTQLGRENSWEIMLENSVVKQDWPQDRPPVFNALSLDEIFITVTNMEVDSLFYARLLNQTGTLQAGSLWFKVGNTRMRLTQAAPGQAPGINYFSVLVSNTDLDAAAEAVFAAGGIIETILPNGFSFWDPDGHRVLVRTAGLY
jgi:catechol 2,3-dioxygenase-like lactoylglutathione lyase family enzyme